VPRSVGVSESPTPPTALTTRLLDFWLLGGASLVVWLVMFLADGFRDSSAVDQQFGNVAFAALSLSLLVNYPHFLASYKLAYGRGARFVFTHWWQLIVVPVALLCVFAAAYTFYDRPIDAAPLVTLAHPRLGDLLLTAAFHVMIVTIGWHYTKQVFGCMMVYARFDHYPLDAAQRQLTKWALFTIWGMSLVDFNIAGSWRWFGTFAYASFDLPDAAGPLSQLVVVAGVVLVIWRVFYANYAATGRTPSASMIVPFAALCVWWLPITRQDEFFYVLAPLFHSLQYLAFVYKVEGTRLRGARNAALRTAATIAGIVLAGWLAFEFLPNAADAGTGTFDAWGFAFFVTAAMLFINIHHYFIDNVIWRFNDPQVRSYLLGEPALHGNQTV
jgi:hypothetical protein